MGQISIIILNYNTSKYTDKCLYSILQFKDINVKEIIVVDNNSTDKNVEHLQQKYPEIKLYLKNENDGFASGCNYGASKASGEYLLFLNPDVFIKENIFPFLISHMNENLKTGILSGVMYDEYENVQYFYNKFPDTFWEISNLYLPILQKKIDRLNIVITNESSNNFEVDWFHGAFILIRKSDFDLIAGFNENYFIYYEDVELCYSVKIKLLKNVICDPNIKYYHTKKSSLINESNDDLYTFHINRSKLLFIKNYRFIKSSGVYLVGMLNIISRIIILPFWNKYRNRKRIKLFQLISILKLFFNDSFLYSSKFKFIKK